MNRLLLLTLALFLCATSPVAQEKPSTNPDEIQIRQLERAWNQAEASQQVNEVSKLVDDTLVYTDYTGSFMNKSEYLKWVAAPDQKADHLFDEGMTVHVYANAAVVNGIYRESGTNKGKKYVIRSRYTDTWIRYGTIWRCVSSASTLIPSK
jgi:ketosteroid isomerase-like protein